VFERANLAPGTALEGPALIVEEDTSTYVSPSFDVAVDAGGALVLTARRSAI
jgi:N-methylhydantoinase A